MSKEKTAIFHYSIYVESNEIMKLKSREKGKFGY